MSGAEPKKPKPRATKAQVEAQRAEAVRLRAEGLSMAAIGERLGVAPERAGELVKPVPPNHCRKCGGQIERQKQYHPQCLSSYRPPTTRPRTGGRAGLRSDLTGRRFGRWQVIHFAGGRKWLCRCRCGVERPVADCSLKDGNSRGCQSCSAKERWARVRKEKRRKKPSR